MKQTILKLTFLWGAILALPIHAMTCPDLKTSSLAYGQIPEPWKVASFSDRPKADENGKFVKANLLGVYDSLGVTCQYETSVNVYTIWWETKVSAPSILDQNWRKAYGGYECAISIDACVFYPQ